MKNSKYLFICLLISIQFGCKNMSNNEVSNDHTKETKSEMTYTIEPTTQPESIAEYKNDCTIIPDRRREISGADYLHLLAQMWHTKRDGDIAYVFGIMRVQYELDGVDTFTNTYVTDVLALSEMNEDMKYKIFDSMREKLKGEGKIIEKCCPAFKNYAGASQYLDLYNDKIKL